MPLRNYQVRGSSRPNFQSAELSYFRPGSSLVFGAQARVLVLGTAAAAFEAQSYIRSNALSPPCKNRGILGARQTDQQTCTTSRWAEFGKRTLPVRIAPCLIDY